MAEEEKRSIDETKLSPELLEDWQDAYDLCMETGKFSEADAKRFADVRIISKIAM